MTPPTDLFQDRREELENALAAVRLRLSRAADNAGRNVEEIELLPITKFFPVTDVQLLASMGCRSFGESRDQEARAKIAGITGAAGLVGPHELRWHMVGQIQRNKARSIAGWATVAHSVSSVRVVEALDVGVAAARSAGVRTDSLAVYVQISLDGDTARGGVDVGDPSAVDALCAAVDGADGLELRGLMGVPPLGADPEAAFARLNAERQRVQTGYRQSLGLSAGMTADMEAAVKHGSTCVRVGTALLGARPLTSP